MQHAAQAIHDIVDARSAAVYHARLFEHGENVGRTLQRCTHLTNDIRKEAAGCALLRDLFCGGFHRFTHDRQDRALGRCHNRRIRLLYTCLKRTAEQNGIGFFGGRKPLGNSRKEL